MSCQKSGIVAITVKSCKMNDHHGLRMINTKNLA